MFNLCQLYHSLSIYYRRRIHPIIHEILDYYIHDLILSLLRISGIICQISWNEFAQNMKFHQLNRSPQPDTEHIYLSCLYFASVQLVTAFTLRTVPICIVDGKSRSRRIRICTAARERNAHTGENSRTVQFPHTHSGDTVGKKKSEDSQCWLAQGRRVGEDWREGFDFIGHDCQRYPSSFPSG